MSLFAEALTLRKTAVLGAAFSSSTLFVSPVLAQTPPVQVTVDLRSKQLTSQFIPGMTSVDWHMTQSPSTANVIADCTGIVNQHLMAWGALDPWPNETDPAPNNWGELDNRLLALKNTGKPIVLTLCTAPWWMKGKLSWDATTGQYVTRTLNASQEWNEDSIVSYRVLDNKVGKWQQLVRATVVRYSKPENNPNGVVVRYFQVWNELKGYYNPNPAVNNYDVYLADADGDPSGNNARHSYIHFYKKTVEAIKAGLTDAGVARSQVKIGGPYPILQSGPRASGMSHPAASTTYNVNGDWGVLDSRPLRAIDRFLGNGVPTEAEKIPLADMDFICADGGLEHDERYGAVSGYPDPVAGRASMKDPFVRAEKIAAVNNWIRSRTSLPIWWSETYYGAEGTDSGGSPMGTIASQELIELNALGAFANIKQVTSGTNVALLWGPLKEGTAIPHLYTMPAVNQPSVTPYHGTYKNFRDHFGNGKDIYPVSIVDSTDTTTAQNNPRVGVIAADAKTLLVNKRNAQTAVALNGTDLTPLTPFEVRLVGTPRPVISVDFIGGSASNGTPSAMAAGEKAGVVPVANWNSLSGVDSTSPVGSVKDANGNVTTTSVAWDAYSVWSLANADTAGNHRMMKGYISTNNDSTTTVTFANLPAHITRNGYDVYVYFDSPNSGQRQGIYRIDTATQHGLDAANVNFSGAFSLSGAGTAGNYVKFSGVTGNGFTLSATPDRTSATTDSAPRAPINGIQIVGR